MLSARKYARSDAERLVGRGFNRFLWEIHVERGAILQRRTKGTVRSPRIG